MAREELQLILTAVNRMSGQVESATRSLKGIELQAQKTQAATTRMSAGFATAAKSIVGLAAGYLTLRAGIGLLQASVLAARESADEQIALRDQVKATGVSWEKYSESVNATVKEVSRYAGIVDEEVSFALRQLILVSNNVAESQRNLSLVFDLAAAKGIDVRASADLVARSMAGNIEILGRYIPEVRDLINALGENATAAQKAEAAMALLRQRVSGSGGAMSEATRATRDLTLAWDEFKETLGQKVEPVLIRVLQRLKSMLQFKGLGIEIVEDLRELNPEFKKMRDAIQSGIDPFAEIPKTAIPSIKQLDTFTQKFGISQQEYAKRIQLAFLVAREQVKKQQQVQSAATEQGVREQNILFDAMMQQQEGQRLAAEERQAEIERWTGSIINFQDIAQNSMQMFTQSVGSAFASAAVFGEDLGKALENVFKQIAANIIAGLIQMGIQRLITAVLFQTANAKESVGRMSALSAQAFAAAFAAVIGPSLIATFPAVPVGIKLALGAATAANAAMLGGAGIAATAGGAAGAVFAGGVPAMAEGGVVTRPTFALIGEAGPEAVVPLRRKGSATFSGGITINFNGPVLGDKQQARQFALMIDKELLDLKRRNMSAALA